MAKNRPPFRKSPQAPERKRDEYPKNWRWIAGRHAITEVLRVHPGDCELLWFRQGWESAQDLRELHDLAGKKRIRIEIRPVAALDRMCASHQGAVMAAKPRPGLELKDIAQHDKGIFLAVDGIEDPHNLGAILRTAWLSEVQGLLIPQDRAVGLTPTVHKVACGGVEHVPILEANQFAPALEQLKEQGYWVFGLSHKAKKNLFEVKFPEKVVWALGAEDKGLRTSTERLCDELISIPQANAAASYNASVALGMALIETRRQHQSRS